MMALRKLRGVVPAVCWLARALCLGLPWLALSVTPARAGSSDLSDQPGAASRSGVQMTAVLPSASAWVPTGAVPISLVAQAGATEAVAKAAPQTSAACFDEAQWLALQRSTAQGAGQGTEQHASKALLYVWSPRMVFSAVHAHEVQQEAQALGLRFVPVHDGRLPAEEVAQALAVLPQKLQEMQNLVPGSAGPHPHSHLHPHPLQTSVPLCAPSLVERDAYRHFPTAWVVQHGGFHFVPLVSAMPPRFWRMGLMERLHPQQKLQQSQSVPAAARQ